MIAYLETIEFTLAEILELRTRNQTVEEYICDEATTRVATRRNLRWQDLETEVEEVYRGTVYIDVYGPEEEL